MLALILAASMPFVIDGGDPEAPSLPTKLPAAMQSQVDTTSDPSQSKIAPADGLNVSIALGASASNVQSTTQLTPFADLVADFPVIVGSGPSPHLRIQLEGLFGGLPGQASVNPQDISTFKTVSFQGGVHWVFGHTALTRASVYLAGGVSSRIGSGPTQPLTKNPAHGEVGLLFTLKDHTASFAVSPLGFSNETGDAAIALRADGRVTLNQAVRIQVSVIVPYGPSPVNWYLANPVRNVVTVVALAVDGDHVFAPKAKP